VLRSSVPARARCRRDSNPQSSCGVSGSVTNHRAVAGDATLRDTGVAPIEPVPLRLKPGDDLREALERFVRDCGREAAFVLAGIGSLERTMLRLAGADEAVRIDGDVEILSLSGSVEPSGSHLHISVADSTGVVRGGHAARGCIVRTTAEVLVALRARARCDDRLRRTRRAACRRAMNRETDR
jgi:uncharacterized protein